MTVVRIISQNTMATVSDCPHNLKLLGAGEQTIMGPVLAHTQNGGPLFCCSRRPAPAAVSGTQDPRPLPLSPAGLAERMAATPVRLFATCRVLGLRTSTDFARFGRPIAVPSSCTAVASPVSCRRRDRTLGRPRARAPERTASRRTARTGEGSKTSRMSHMHGVFMKFLAACCVLWACQKLVAPSNTSVPRTLPAGLLAFLNMGAMSSLSLCSAISLASRKPAESDPTSRYLRSPIFR